MATQRPNKREAFYAAYMESKARLAAGLGDIRDDALVSIWDMAVSATKTRDTIVKQHRELSDKHQQALSRLLTKTHECEIAEARCRMLSADQVSLTEYELEKLKGEPNPYMN
jgi:hypothetical protein